MNSITQESSFETTKEESRNECHVGTEQVWGKEGGRKKRKLETAGTVPKLAPPQILRGKLALEED